MYKLLLILKYLRRKLLPLFAALAVTICTFMVIVVLSVMGGFLELLQDSARKLTGDVVISGSMRGFGHYEELIGELTALPEVAAATPVVKTFGALNLASHTAGVQVVGIRPQEFARIVQYDETLQWTKADIDASGDPTPLDPRVAGMTMDAPPEVRESISGRLRPTMVIGIEANPFHSRDEEGKYNFERSLVANEATLTVFPLSRSGNITTPEYQTFVIVNEFKSGLYDVDSGVVFVPFGELQRMLGMGETKGLEGFDPITGEGGQEVTIPGRASEVLVKAKDGYGADQAAAAVDRVVEAWARRHPDVFPPRVMTWEEVHASLINAVKNETGLVTFLFAVISLVAVVMVATTFYMIVLEKTRDIGVLRAIGASAAGIRHIFLGYGFAVGVVGSLLGLLLAILVVHNLNEIQAFLYATIGWRMWDPQTYFFDRIPDRVDPTNATVIVIGAILSSVIGALVPAFLAARQDPVKSLRYE